MVQDRPVGPILENWQVPCLPNGKPLEGRYVRLEKLDADLHAVSLFNVFRGHEWVWDYMPVGPFASSDGFESWVREATESDDILFYAILNQETGEYGGFASFLRMKPISGSIEVGFIAMAPVLQRTRAATEAMHLMMKWAFESGYRRYEWKCDALNRPSRSAAQRLGLSYEGIFRQATVVKGRNRDTAWFAAVDTEWPALHGAFETWLAPDNFDANGKQIQRLSDLTAKVRVSSDPLLT